MRFRTLAFGCAATLALGLSAAWAALPGPHRALAPARLGLTEAAPGLWIDDPAKVDAARALAAAADDTVAAFFGPLKTRPRIVLCTGAPCAETFGLAPKGLTYGAHLILIGPEGMNETIVTHERTHAELHRDLRLSDLWAQRIPTWFDEGLATHLSGDTNLDIPADARAADWICAARVFRDWGRMHIAHEARATYGAAARLVAEIEETHGRAALLTLVTAVEQGADFEAEYARLMAAVPACAAPPS